jgi:hypothetical protein
LNANHADIPDFPTVSSEHRGIDSLPEAGSSLRPNVEDGRRLAHRDRTATSSNISSAGPFADGENDVSKLLLTFANDASSPEALDQHEIADFLIDLRVEK